MQLRTEDFEDVLDIDVTQAIVLAQAADEVPFVSAMTALGNVRPAGTTRVEWYTDSLPERRTQINNGGAAYTGATNVLVVDDESLFQPDDLVLCEATGEVMLVALVNAGASSITVVRGIGDVIAGSAASVADNAYLKNIGTTSGEGADSPEAINFAHTQNFNFCQRNRKAVELTGTAERQATKTEDERGVQRRNKFAQFIRDRENLFIFGARSADQIDGTGKRQHTMGGIYQAIQTHVDNVGGVMDSDRFYQFAEQAFAEGSSEKWLFAGSTVMGVLASIYGSFIEVESIDGLNLRFNRIPTPYGVFNLALHRGMKGSYAQEAIAVDPMQTFIRPLGQDMLPHLVEDVQQNGADAVKDEWRSEETLEYGSESSHALLTGVTG